MIPTSLKITQPSLPNQQPTQPITEPTQQTTQQPNSVDFIDSDDFLNRFKVAKQTTALTPDAPSENVPSEPVAPQQEIYVPSEPLTPMVKPPMDDTEAESETAKWMRFRENLQAYGISWYADGNFSGAEKYTYKNHQFNQLVKAWTPVVQNANVRLPPMADIALAELMCTGPLLGLMNQNRKYRKELEAARKQNEQLKQQISDEASKRADAKYLWEIGENGKGEYGYFTRTQGGTYLAKDKRTERPKLTPENIELLTKHNGKASVDKLLSK